MREVISIEPVRVRDLRARLMEGALRAAQDEIMPMLSNPGSIDSTEHIIRSIALQLVEDGWNADWTAEYARRAGMEIDQKPGCVQWEVLEALRIKAAERPSLAAIQAEDWLQELIVHRRAEVVRSFRGRIDQQARSVDAELQAYLQRVLAEPGLRVDRADAIAGGRSKRTYRLTISGSTKLPHECILRADRSENLTGKTTSDESRILQELSKEAGIPSPQLLLTEADDAVLGGTFMILEACTGTKGGEYFPEVYPAPDGIGQIVLDLAAAIGRLHALDPTRLAASPLRVDSGWFLREINQTYKRARGIGLRSAEFEAANAWLKENVSLGECGASVVHGDVGLHNVLVENGRLTALVDWELSGLGAAAGDIASIRHLADLTVSWEDFCAAYLGAGGPVHAVDPHHLEFHTVLRYFRITATSYLCRYNYVSGASNDLAIGNAGYDFAIRARRLLSRAMMRIFAKRKQ